MYIYIYLSIYIYKYIAYVYIYIMIICLFIHWHHIYTFFVSWFETSRRVFVSVWFSQATGSAIAARRFRLGAWLWMLPGTAAGPKWCGWCHGTSYDTAIGPWSSPAFLEIETIQQHTTGKDMRSSEQLSLWRQHQQSVFHNAISFAWYPKKESLSGHGELEQQTWWGSNILNAGCGIFMFRFLSTSFILTYSLVFFPLARVIHPLPMPHLKRESPISCPEYRSIILSDILSPTA